MALRNRVAAARSRFLGHGERLRRRFPVITAITSALVRVRFVDEGTRLASQVFLSLVPLMFVAAAVTPFSVHDDIVGALRSNFGLNGSSVHQLELLFGSQDDDAKASIGAVGAIVTLLSATSASRVMQSICERAWDLPKSGSRIAAWRWIVWLVSWVVVLILQAQLRRGFGLGLWLGLPLAAASSVGVWWWTQHLLLCGRRDWRALLPGSLLTAAAMLVLSGTAALYVPRALNRSLDAYGAFGAVLTLLTWLIVVCTVIVCSLTIGAVVSGEGWCRRLVGAPPPAPENQPGPAGRVPGAGL